MKNITEEVKQHIRENYYYNSVTGDLWRKYKNYARVIGGKHRQGYLLVHILDKVYYVHRVCWFLYFGKFPDKFIDHIDMNKSNNRINNLREASAQQNQFNRTKHSDNTSGFKGVSFYKNSKKWRAAIRFNKTIHIGYYNSKEEASAAYQKKAAELFGEFNPHKL